MAPDVDIAVVGAGIVGVATARALAAEPGTVVLLERFEPGHGRGGSHGSSRIFRLNYADVRFVRLAQAADAAWRDLERERGVRLVERVGSLDLGPVVPEIERALRACGVHSETLSAADVRARWPLRLDPDETAVYQQDGGFTYADRAYAELLEAAVAGGVEVRAGTAVRALEDGRRSIRVLHDGGEVEARAVVVAAGAWSPPLLAPLGIDLPVVPTRETVAYLALAGAETIPSLIDYGRLPAPGHGRVARTGQAAYALCAPGRGLKAGLHHSGPAVDPDHEGGADERLASWVAEWAASRYEGVEGLVGAETCLYANTADEGFVLERHGRVVVGSACSGHGFKFAPVVGRTLAALAREAAT